MPDRVPRLEFAEEEVTSVKMKESAEIVSKKVLKADKTRKKLSKKSGLRMGLKTVQNPGQRDQAPEGTEHKQRSKKLYRPKRSPLRTDEADTPREPKLRTDAYEQPESPKPYSDEVDVPGQPSAVDLYPGEMEVAAEPGLPPKAETTHAEPEASADLDPFDEPKKSTLHTEEKAWIKKSRMRVDVAARIIEPRLCADDSGKSTEYEAHAICPDEPEYEPHTGAPENPAEPTHRSDDPARPGDYQLPSNGATIKGGPGPIPETSSKTHRSYPQDKGQGNTRKTKLRTEKTHSQNSKLQTEEPTAPKSILQTEETSSRQRSKLVTGDTDSAKKSRLRTDEADTPKKPQLIQDEKKASPKRRQAVARAAAAVSEGVRHEVATEDKDDGNVGTESMLYFEAAAERGGRLLSDAHYSHQLKQSRETSSAERAAGQADVTTPGELPREKHPDGTSNPLSRQKQKEAIKHSYAAAKAGKAAGDTITASEATRSAAEAVSKGVGTGQKVAEAAAKVAPVLAVVGCISLLVLLLLSVLESCTVILSGALSTIADTSYTAEPDEILAAEGYYLTLEDDLYTEIHAIEDTYPGYDAYEYDYDESQISHDPHQLAAYLTVLLDDYTAEEAKPYMDQVFAAQYDLTVDEITYGAYGYTVLRVTLTCKTIDEVAKELLDEESFKRYQACVAIQGLQPDVFIPPDPTDSPTTG